MAWTAPKRYSINDATVVADLNTYIRDNMNEMSPAKTNGKGDVLGATAANTIDDENVGSNGTILSVDSTSARGFSAKASGFTGTRAIWLQPGFYVEGNADPIEGSNSSGGTGSHWGVGTNTTDGSVYLGWRVPSDFSSLDSAIAIMKGEAKNLYWSANSQWGAVGSETHNVSTDSISVAAISSGWTANDLETWDLAALFTGIVADDHVGFRLLRNGANASDDGTGGGVLYGVLIEYTTT